MAFSEKITLMVDVVTGNAKSGLAGIKADMAQTEGAFNKLKVGAKGAFDTIGVMGPQVALAAGAALVGFGVKAVKAFQDTALAAGEMADATGLSVEDASKWIEVADHIDVSSGAVESAFRRMGVAIGNNSKGWTDLNLQVSKNADGSINLSETFLNVVNALNAMEDPTKRAAAAQKLFGKGFAEVAELIGKDASKLREELSRVGEEKIIDEAELAKARDLRGALDDLGDSIQEFGIGLGETLVPAVTDGVKKLNEFVIAARSLGDVIDEAKPEGGLLDQIIDFSERNMNPFKIAADNIEILNDALGNGGEKASEFGASLDTFEARAVGVSGVLGHIDTTGLEEVETAADEAGDAIDEVKIAYQLMKDTLTVEEGALNLDDLFAEVKTSAEEAYTAVATGAADADEKIRNNAQEVNNLKQRVIDYGDQVLGLPPERVTEILAMIDQGKLTQADAALDKAAAERTAAIKAKEQNTSAVEKAFNNAARVRVAAMNAKANAGGAESTLNNTARTRTATINAIVNAGNAAGQLSDLARTRYATIVAQTRVVGAVGATASLQHGGPVPGGKSQGVPIMAHGGEYVLDAGTVDAIKSGRQSAGSGKNGALAGVGGGGSLNIHFHGPVLGTKAEFGRYIDEALAESRRRGNRVA